MNSLTIQPAIAGDADELSDLACASKAIWGYPPEFMAVCREVLRVSPDTIESQPCYVYVDEGGLIKGFYLLENLGSSCNLDMLFIAPDATRKGIGAALLKHALGQATSMGSDRLLVTSDPQALPFYVSSGGVQIGWEVSEVIDDRMLPRLEFML